MPYLRWEDFRARHPRAHLIVGEAGDGNADNGNASILRTFAAGRLPRGDYAVRIAEDGTAWLGIETDYDADMLRQALGAERTPSPSDWISCARFSLDDACRQAEKSRE
jgi:hypothetical protein